MTALARLLGQSPGITAVREQVFRLLRHQGESARRLPPILILGETGTGKGLLAELVHRTGPRARGPFVDVNCAAIPETLLEAELFGFEKGAFTDARQAKPGLFQAAHGGTIFLDEIGLMPEALQAKLLKVIEEGAVRRLGSTRREPTNAWVVAATSEDLQEAVRARRFREDLYHRLAVLPVRLPPLRERGEDVVQLAEHFLAQACEDYGLPGRELSPERPGRPPRLFLAGQRSRAGQCHGARRAPHGRPYRDRRGAGARIALRGPLDPAVEPGERRRACAPARRARGHRLESLARRGAPGPPAQHAALPHGQARAHRRPGIRGGVGGCAGLFRPAGRAAAGPDRRRSLGAASRDLALRGAPARRDLRRGRRCQPVHGDRPRQDPELRGPGRRAVAPGRGRGVRAGARGGCPAACRPRRHRSAEGGGPRARVGSDAPAGAAGHPHRHGHGRAARGSRPARRGFPAGVPRRARLAHRARRARDQRGEQRGGALPRAPLRAGAGHRDGECRASRLSPGQSCGHGGAVAIRRPDRRAAAPRRAADPCRERPGTDRIAGR